MKVRLIRYAFLNVCIFGIIITPDNTYYSLELPWLDNARNRSCIPPGTYKCRYLSKSASGKYRNIYHVTNVPGRSGILIHNGNIPDHTKGCIIIGSRKGSLYGLPAVLNSRSALSSFVNDMDRQSFDLEVIDGMAG